LPHNYSNSNINSNIRTRTKKIFRDCPPIKQKVFRIAEMARKLVDKFNIFFCVSRVVTGKEFGVPKLVTGKEFLLPKVVTGKELYSQK
jgi:hypothetical protein